MDRYNRHNRRKYSLKVYIVFVTKYRKQLLKGSIADDVKQKIFDIANTRGYEIIAMETDKDHMHFLISYDTTDRVCDIVKIVKQDTTHITYGKSMVRFCLNNIGRKGYFGQTDTLLAVLEKYRQRLYKSILKVRVNGERFTRLLPPPEGSGRSLWQTKGFNL